MPTPTGSPETPEPAQRAGSGRTQHDRRHGEDVVSDEPDRPRNASRPPLRRRRRVALAWAALSLLAGLLGLLALLSPVAAQSVTSITIKGTTTASSNNAPTVATAIPDQTATKSDDTALPSWLSFTAATLDAGTVSVKVTASDGNGGSVSDTFDVPSVPSVPNHLSASTGGDTRINLSWTAPGYAGDSPIIGYKIEVSPDGNANWTELVTNTGNTTTTYAHIGLAVGTTRHYRVSAINSAGVGDPSNIDDAITGPITDTTAPRVSSIVRETPTSSPTNADSLTWRVTFSERGGLERVCVGLRGERNDRHGDGGRSGLRGDGRV